jgi:hypothetical protein
MTTILLLGSTGMFGKRLAERLCGVPDVKLLVASRSLARARALSGRFGRGVAPVALANDISETLEQVKPDVVIDCSGPFQGMSYDVARKVIAAGCHLIDLADAPEYLLGFEATLDADAKARGLVALSGVSSTPCLSTAVVAELTKGWQRIDAVDLAILPDGKNNIGRAVAEGTLSYAGKQIKVFRYGRMTIETGWLRGEIVTVPGVVPRTVSPAETVDAEILPQLFKVQSRVQFRAGLESTLEHGGLRLLALLRRLRVLKSLQFFAGALLSASRIIRRLGSGSGGMVVRVCGLDAQGTWAEAHWSVRAADGHGPYVPILPIVAAVRALLRGRFKPGARMASLSLVLEDITKEFAGLSLQHERHEETMTLGPFEMSMGRDAFGAMAPGVQAFHKVTAEPVWTGRGSVARGRNLLSRLVGAFVGLPPATDDTDVRVSVERDAAGTEVWTRMFGGRLFRSVMSADQDNKLYERFGPALFELGVARVGDGPVLPVKRGWFWGVPIPRFLLPRSDAREFVDGQGRFNFDVRITLPFVGLLAHYKGWLEPVVSRA